MRKRIALLLLVLLPNLYVVNSQTLYEKGIFIDSSGTKTECLIENKDWEACPNEFSYKLSEHSERQKVYTSTLIEFEVFGSFKYVRREVKIDKSRSGISELSPTKNPVWLTEKLFLKVLVEGKASLYMYTEYNLVRFFYSVNDSSINQLVYKNYLAETESGGTQIGTNANFRQQLYAGVNLPDYSVENMIKLAYEQAELTKYFTKYNALFQTKKDEIIVKSKRDCFNFRASTGLNQRNLKINNSIHSIASQNFGQFIFPYFGIELEYVLPIRNNKWSIIFNPIYNFQIQKQISLKRYSDDKPIVNEFQYQSIEFPLGLRYRYFINNKLNVFFNGFARHGFIEVINSKFIVEETNLGVFGTDIYLSGGMGLEYDKFSVEIRNYNTRIFFLRHQTWDFDNHGISLMFSYKLVDVKVNK